MERTVKAEAKDHIITVYHKSESSESDLIMRRGGHFDKGSLFLIIWKILKKILQVLSLYIIIKICHTNLIIFHN